MAKLGKQLKLKVTVSVVDQCAECGSIAEMINDGDAYHLECPACGSQGYRYETKALARKDWPDHHSIPKRKVKAVA